MAPRQRFTPQPSQDEITSLVGQGSTTITMHHTMEEVAVDDATLSLSDDEDNDDINSKPLLITSSSSSHVVDHTSSNVNIQQHRTYGTCKDDYFTIELARDRHDIFNIVALVFVVAATLINWDFRLILQGPSHAWKGQYFYMNWATTVSYFLIDLIWVARVPICVKSPDVIIKHHFVAIAYLSGPLAWPEFRWFMGACLSVEINTWFLILRRVLYKRKDRIHPICTELVSFSFYVTWIAIRIFLYPMIMYIFIQMAYDKIIETGVLWHWPMMFMPVHFFLCILNLKWSYDLFQPIITQYISKSNRDIGVSGGL